MESLNPVVDLTHTRRQREAGRPGGRIDVRLHRQEGRFESSPIPLYCTFCRTVGAHFAGERPSPL